MKLRLKVVPGASRNSHEWMAGEEPLLKIRTTAPPEKGKANRAVEKYLAQRLGLARGQVTITSGSTSRQKVVDITGLPEAKVITKLTCS